MSKVNKQDIASFIKVITQIPNTRQISLHVLREHAGEDPYSFIVLTNEDQMYKSGIFVYEDLGYDITGMINGYSRVLSDEEITDIAKQLGIDYSTS